MKSDLSQRLGVCSWSLGPRNPAELVERVRACGLQRIQLSLSPLVDQPEIWGDVGEALSAADMTAVSGMFGCVGEDYSTLDSIRRTGGLAPDEHWDANRRHAEAVLHAGLKLGIRTITSHVGFIPPDINDPAHDRLAERVAAIADLFATEGVMLLLETGQETAADLNEFLANLNRSNVGVNFDPANMILYGKGDPLDALKQLLPMVRQVHLKDAVSTATPGTWGQEKRLGDGEVDWPRFLSILDEGGYDGLLIVEREAGSARVEDVRHAVSIVTAA